MTGKHEQGRGSDIRAFQEADSHQATVTIIAKTCALRITVNRHLLQQEGTAYKITQPSFFMFY
ncbi:hypothetical protein J2Z22_003319 [Paenibacillus forsythiae]|uniref:Uncharacterized protein n=1 Tax=Paenibacillus forsythiae TaxID=365616 RepID=A0ABU3HAA6_9BACL|nr:hypothetical protein [Paenibacillus forsythiae]